MLFEFYTGDMTKEQDKKLEEQEYLNGFKETNIGKQFYENCSIADVFEATEQPDFILAYRYRINRVYCKK